MNPKRPNNEFTKRQKNKYTMKKQYIEPQMRVIETEFSKDVLTVTSPGPGFGEGPGSGSVGAKESIWGWDWDEEW